MNTRFWIVTIFLIGISNVASAGSFDGKPSFEKEPTPEFAEAMSDDLGTTEAPTAEIEYIAFGFNAVPLLNFGLNLVNIMENTGQGAEGLVTWPVSENVLFLKYNLMQRYGVIARASVRLNYNNETNSSFQDHPVESVDPDIDEPQEIENIASTSLTSILVAGGIEIPRSLFPAVKGYYGVEGLLGFSSSHEEFESGWSLSKRAADLGVISNGTSRTLEQSSGFGFSIGARSFMGLEYYIHKQVSLTAEYGWSLMYSRQGRGEISTETWEMDDTGTGGVTSETKPGSSSHSGFRAAIDNGAGSWLSGDQGQLSLMVHF